MSQGITIASVTESGDSVALLFTRDSAARIGLRVGDLMQVSAFGQELTITRCDPDMKRQLEIAKQVMDERREVLRKLAE